MITNVFVAYASANFDIGSAVLKVSVYDPATLLDAAYAYLREASALQGKNFVITNLTILPPAAPVTQESQETK